MKLKYIICGLVLIGTFGISYLFVFDHWKMNGHWHLHRNLDSLSFEREFLTIDYEDRFGTVNRNIEISFPLGYYMNSFNKTSEIFAECYHEEFTYKINQDSLKLFSKKGIEIYKGYKCRLICCDKESDYFSAIPFNISLRSNCDSGALDRKDVHSVNCIFLSDRRRNDIKIGYGVYEFTDLDKWVSEIENTYSYKSSRDHKIIIYVDKESDQCRLEELKQNLCQAGVRKLYIGYKCELIQNSFQVKLRKTDLSCKNASNTAPPSTRLMFHLHSFG